MLKNNFFARRKILKNIVDYVLAEVVPRKLFRRTTFGKDLKKFQRIAVISIGKAGRPMARAVLPLLKRKPDFILIADKGHPLPTQEGVEVTKKIISIARGLTEKDLAIVLISGGGSAMLVAPVPKITLTDKIAVTKALLRSGATINEMNVVRKHLSQVKGGNLAALFYPATVHGFVISDVVGNDLSTIASGPLTPDPSTFADALKIIKKYRVKAPLLVMRYLTRGLHDKKLETPKYGEKYFKKVTTKIIADHALVAQKTQTKAKKMGLHCLRLPHSITGEARDTARAFVKKAKKKSILIASGETTVTCKGNGHGGRNQEFVLSGLRYLKPGQTLLSIGTDGVDGICPEDVAGSFGDEKILSSAKKQKLNIEDFLKRNDSYTFFKKTGGLIKTGKTGTNLGDLSMLLNS